MSLPDRKKNRLENYDYSQNGASIFQRSYYDHVIRNKEDYNEIWAYIDNNPQKNQGN